MPGLTAPADVVPITHAGDSGLAGGPVVDIASRAIASVATALESSAFRRLTDLLLLPAAMLHPQERSFAIDMLHFALDGADEESRRQLSERLARAGSIAPSLVARLVHDHNLQVARPLLLHGACVTDHDLTGIVRNGCSERGYLIACRSELAAEVVAAIVDRADAHVVYAALRNAAARFTPDAIARAAQRARVDPSLCEPLLLRPEMNPACALDLFWTADCRLRSYILTRFLAESGTVCRIVRGQAATPSVPAQQDRARAGQAEAPDRLQTDVMGVAADLGSGRFGDAAHRISALAGVSHATAQRIVGDQGGECIAVAFKAAGATRSTFLSAIALWRKPDGDSFLHPGVLDDLPALFERLSRGHACMAMTYWDWREAAIGPYSGRDNPLPDMFDAAPTGPEE